MTSLNELITLIAVQIQIAFGDPVILALVVTGLLGYIAMAYNMDRTGIAIVAMLAGGVFFTYGLIPLWVAAIGVFAGIVFIWYGFTKLSGD